MGREHASVHRIPTGIQIAIVASKLGIWILFGGLSLGVVSLWLSGSVDYFYPGTRAAIVVGLGFISAACFYVCTDAACCDSDRQTQDAVLTAFAPVVVGPTCLLLTATLFKIIYITVTT